MNKNIVKGISKCALFGAIWSGVLFAVALFIRSKYGYNLNDILFVEGIAIVIVALLWSFGGNPTGLNIQAFPDQNAQYVGTANLEISRLEREKTKGIVKNTVQMGVSTISLVIGGAITIILNFLV